MPFTWSPGTQISLTGCERWGGGGGDTWAAVDSPLPSLPTKPPTPPYPTPTHPNPPSELRKNHGKEEARARDLFYALWISDLFMSRVEANAEWSLFCPNEAPGLADCWGQEFETLYTRWVGWAAARLCVEGGGQPPGAA